MLWNNILFRKNLDHKVYNTIRSNSKSREAQLFGRESPPRPKTLTPIPAIPQVIPQHTGQPGQPRYPSSYIALKPDRPGSPLFSLVQNTSHKGEILEVVFRNGWG